MYKKYIDRGQMMNNFVIRTEELEDSQLKELYVETENDNDILN